MSDNVFCNCNCKTVVVLGCTVTDDFENVLTASTLVVTLLDLICLFFGINLFDTMDILQLYL